VTKVGEVLSNGAKHTVELARLLHAVPRSACAARTTTAPRKGARFEVHVAKGRTLRGKPALPFEAKLSADEGRAFWNVKAIVDVQAARVQALLSEGMSIRDIAEETGIPRSTVHRIKERDTPLAPVEAEKDEEKQ
jgi:DNA-binding NarL/FixJ family response regulator